MSFSMINEDISNFYNKLVDEESKELFDTRYAYFIDRDVNKLEERIMKSVVKRHREEVRAPFVLNQYYRRHPENKDKDIVIFGAGIAGKRSIRTLKSWGKANVVGVVDNNPSLYSNHVVIEGICVENPEIIKTKYADSIIFLAVQSRNQIDVVYQLIGLGVNESNIVIHKEGSLFSGIGEQYFDVDYLIPSSAGEIFLDCGCFDGGTSIAAERWAKGNLQQVYAFEADSDNVNKCNENLSKLNCKYELYNIATWNGKSKMSFSSNSLFGYASKISNNGNVTVDADSIDNVLAGRSATFIKFDVEGAELKSLEGAINTIKNNRPKLAISIYHKPEDIIEIPLFLENLGLDYKYCIRHYQTRYCETVLYAF